MGEEGVPTYSEYINQNLKNSETLGFDGKVISGKTIFDLKNEFGNKDITLEDKYDLVGEIWKDRPSLPITEVFILDEKYAGESFKSKLNKLREKMEALKADKHILTSLDDIAWLFNIRGRDIKNNPVTLAYSIISKDKVTLYIDSRKINDDVRRYLEEIGVEIKDYFEVYEDVKNSENEIVLLDNDKVNYLICNSIKGTILNRNNPTTLMKACKNPVELENLRSSHLKDGVAVTKFMYWLKTNIGKIEMSEISVSDKIEEYRKEQKLYIEPSFNTISAYEANAAMMHYSANEKSNSKLYPRNLLLIDSGAQYLDGTTDITRTFVLGECPEEIKEHFTLVLKGMISLSKVKFLYGARGTNLDILARRPVWERGIDYKCGTGHGVGFLLNVHEGPQGIRFQTNPQILEEGMTVTNEPGVYIEGSHGIRLENELIVKKAEKTVFGQFMEFETMTYVPLDLDGVIPEMLEKDEREFLNIYHKMVFDKVSPYLTAEEKEWLKEYTREI